jgi:hypothetical protein
MMGYRSKGRVMNVIAVDLGTIENGCVVYDGISTPRDMDIGIMANTQLAAGIRGWFTDAIHSAHELVVEYVSSYWRSTGGSARS